MEPQGRARSHRRRARSPREGRGATGGGAEPQEGRGAPGKGAEPQKEGAEPQRRARSPRDVCVYVRCDATQKKSYQYLVA